MSMHSRSVLFLLLSPCVLAMQSALSSPRIAVVTGANKGIGLEIARKLGKTEGFMCVLAARNAAAGQEAAEILRADGANVEFQQLDIDDASSVRDFATRMHDAHGRIHVLVNNAAIAFKASDPTPFAQQAEPTMRTNFWNTVAVTDALLPLVRNTDGEGRVVFVASSAGRLGILKQRSHQELVTKEALTRDELYGFINRFVMDVTAGIHAQNGWPSSNYGMSKLGVIAFSKILAREEASNGIVVNALCPGYCQTDMSSHHGFKTAEEGARTPYLLATMPDHITGGFWSDERQVDW